MIDDATAVLDAIRTIVQALRASATAVERRTGLGSAQLFVLRRLVERGPLSLGGLAAATATHASSVSVVAARLVAAGLVRRQADPGDGRRIALSATARGAALVRGAPAPEQERLLAAIARLPAARRRGLARGLSDLVGALGLDRAHPPMFFEERRSTHRRAARRRG